MILSRKSILDGVVSGKITIDPFDPFLVGPNSVDCHLGNKLLKVLPNCIHGIDPALPQVTFEYVIPEGGLWIHPNELWLGETVERIGSGAFVPMIVGRSSIARMGLWIEISAGLGDVGWGTHPDSGRWTLELSCVLPIKVYPNMRIGQVYFHEVTDNEWRYGWEHPAHYAGQDGVEASKFSQKPTLQH